ncbi:MAG: LamG-like jellyroll fold domain-containing protein [Nanoarchaeota archaeon]
MLKRGLSSVVASLIMILLVFVGIGIVWFAVKNILEQNAEEVNLDKINVAVDIQKVSIYDNTATVTVTRSSGEGDISGIKFVFSDGINSQTFQENISLAQLEQRTFSFNTIFNSQTLKKVEVYPIFNTGTSGEVVIGKVDSYIIEDNTNICNPSCTGRQCGDNGCGNPTECGSLTKTCNFTTGTCTTNGTQICSNWLYGACSAVNQSQANCAGKYCGSDGCGGVCRTCSFEELCINQICTRNDTQFLGNIQGLVSWWRFNGNANDEMGMNNGNLNGGMNCNVAGKYGNACGFDKINDKIVISHNNNLNIGLNNYTLNLWLYPYGLKNSCNPSCSDYIFFEKTQSSDSFWFRLRDDDWPQFYYQNLSNWYDRENNGLSTNIKNESWNMITFSFTRGSENMGFYINGVFMKVLTPSGSSTLGTNISSTGSLTIGGYFNGTIDEVVLFNRSLNSSEISTLYGLNLSM